MDLHWRPVGPEPTQTYWLRRAAILGALLVLLLLLRAVWPGGGDDTVRAPGAAAGPSAAPAPPAPAPPAPSGTPSPGPTPSSSPSPGTTSCEPTDLTVTASAEREQYPVGGRPLLLLGITNTGGTPCLSDLGQAAVELFVQSGSDRVWSSDDCAPGGDVDQVELAPAEERVIRLTWSARRSLPGCEGGTEQVEAGTYRVGARVGELRVEGDTFLFE